MDASSPEHEVARQQMVLMTSLTTTYATLRAGLQEEIAKAPWPSPEAGFLDYLRSTNGTRLEQHSMVDRKSVV